MDEIQDLYAVLGVAPSAPYEVIRAAYRVMAKMHHPDVNKQTSGLSTKMALINHAYQILSYPISRHEFDQQLEKMKKYADTNLAHQAFKMVAPPKYHEKVLTTYDHRGRLNLYV
jgi:DnaJ-class molecular chaperone